MEPAHGPQAHIEIEQLAQRDVQRPDAAADRGRQRALDADVVGAERLDGVVGQPRVELLETFFAGKDLAPLHAALAAVRFRYGRVEDTNARAPDVGAGAVAFDERDDRIVRHDELRVLS